MLTSKNAKARADAYARVRRTAGPRATTRLMWEKPELGYEGARCNSWRGVRLGGPCFQNGPITP
eukprot:3263098-Lingulodinium_polyedra.AAC.1